jgi:predicted dehydrogenase
MITTAERQQRLLGVVFQHRFRPDIRALKKLVHSRELGMIQHVMMSAVWTRTASYYRSASWRGTWRGEGGGVLMNQAPHHLDILCHLFGLPARVFSWNRTRMHEIETEDTVQASLEWSNGAVGSLHISTAEADQAEYLKIVGTRGQLELHQGKLTGRLLDIDLKEFLISQPDPFAVPPTHPLEIVLEPGKGDHWAVYQAFEHALTDNEPFTSTGIEGRMSLELANALIYSSHVGKAVEMPLDREKYTELLARLQG